MEALNSIIAENLKKIRTEQGLSLDKVSKLSGVSKSMLGQIERGESNPTISTVWKIANGLKISFSSLLNQAANPTVIMTEEDVTPMTADNGNYKIYPYFPFEEGRNFEMYKIVVKAGGKLMAEAHNKGIVEYITAFYGDIKLVIDGEDFIVKKGSSIRFRADRPHGYENQGDTTVELSVVIYYPEV